MPNDWTDKMLSDKTYCMRFEFVYEIRSGTVYCNSPYVVCLLVFLFIFLFCFPVTIMCMSSAKERRRYIVTSSLIG